jgi:hypothetical protein
MGYPEEAGVEVAVEWTPAAVLRPLSSSTQRRAEVEVVLTADASALVSSHGGRFFRHLTATKPVREKLFSASAVPQSSLCNLEVRASSRACQPGRETRMLSAGVDHHRHRSWAPHSVWRPHPPHSTGRRGPHASAAARVQRGRLRLRRPRRRRFRTAMKKSRIVRLGFDTARQKRVLE